MVANRVLLLSPEEYLEWEERSEVRHEFIDGEVFSMAGASDDHSVMIFNLSSIPKNSLSSNREG